jgi:hypothetical protein
MGIQQKISWFSVERSRTLSGMESWSGSLPRNGFRKQIHKDPSYWKEIDMASKPWNRDAKTLLRERVDMMIEKKNRGTLERCRDLSKTRKQFERSTPFSKELLVVGNLTQPGRHMSEAYRARRYTFYTGP